MIWFKKKNKSKFTTELKRSSLSMRWRQRLGVWQGDAQAVQKLRFGSGSSRERSDGSNER